MPLHRRLPKRGFNNLFSTDYNEVNIGRNSGCDRRRQARSANADHDRCAGRVRRLRQAARRREDPGRRRTVGEAQFRSRRSLEKRSRRYRKGGRLDHAFGGAEGASRSLVLIGQSYPSSRRRPITRQRREPETPLPHGFESVLLMCSAARNARLLRARLHCLVAKTSAFSATSRDLISVILI